MKDLRPGYQPCDERCDDHVLLKRNVAKREPVNGELGHDVRRRDEASDHGEGMLEAHHQRSADEEERQRGYGVSLCEHNRAVIRAKHANSYRRSGSGSSSG